ncbi:hypothetical protein RI367_003263 [Sorochytrium milnesiophthora]
MQIKDLRYHPSGRSSGASPQNQCQKCLKYGHFTYECRNERVYVHRVSWSKQLENPALAPAVSQRKPPPLPGSARPGKGYVLLS